MKVASWQASLRTEKSQVPSLAVMHVSGPSSCDPAGTASPVLSFPGSVELVILSGSVRHILAKSKGCRNPALAEVT